MKSDPNPEKEVATGSAPTGNSVSVTSSAATAPASNVRPASVPPQQGALSHNLNAAFRPPRHPPTSQSTKSNFNSSSAELLKQNQMFQNLISKETDTTNNQYPPSVPASSAFGNGSSPTSHSPPSSLVNSTNSIRSHGRNVSWDSRVVDNAIEQQNLQIPEPPVLPRQPVLSGESTLSSAGDESSSLTPLPPNPPSSTNLPPPRPTLTPKLAAKPMLSKRRLDLGDVIDPMELEAETYILKALDERDPMRRRTNTEGSILSQVPNDAAHDFTVSPVPPGTTKSPSNSAPPSPGASSAMIRPAPPKPTPSSPSKESSNKAHRRQLTVEQNLFGLTAALSAVNQSSLPAGGGRPVDNNNNLGDASIGSHERLARTVGTLFNRTVVRNSSTDATSAGQDNKDGHATVSTSQAAARWGSIKTNLEQYKKTDGEGPASSAVIDTVGGKDTDSVRTPIKEEVDLEAADGSSSSDDESEDENGDISGTKHGKGREKNPFRHLPYGSKIKDEWDTVQNFLQPRRTGIYTYLKITILYLIIPMIGIAAILFHVAGNPPNGVGRDRDTSTASASWWLTFAARQVVTFSLSKMMEMVIIDFLTLQTRFTLSLAGPVVTLLIVQSKGWPFIVMFWGIWDFALVAGDHAFARHWLFWQDFWGLFNESNPAGDVLISQPYFRVLSIAVSVGAVVSVKRLVVGLYLGRKTFSNYAEQLAKVMNKMLLISEVASHAKEVEKKSWRDEKRRLAGKRARTNTAPEIEQENLRSMITAADEDDDLNTITSKSVNSSLGAFEKIVDDVEDGPLSQSQKAKIAQLLGNWEEPQRGKSNTDNVPVSAVLQFRRALAHMDTDFPFSPAFGLADTRETCVAAAQDVYLRLLLRTPDSGGVLPFDTLARIALSRDGELDEDKVKALIRIFRPDRDGTLSLLDFARSIDAVYKELRLLRATVASSSKIDEALENIINVIFYATMAVVILSQLGFDPLALFLSLSSIILAFAFMIGSASAKYFEGLLFILVQRPYGIGDRINVSNSESEANAGGAQGWIVEDVTLFTTSVVLAATNEKATISNGTLAKSRIINGGRSPKAILFFLLKFGLDVPYAKVEIFKSAIEKFAKARPREWMSILGFRATRVEADLGFIEYCVVLQHRDRWQNMGALLQSKAIIQSFALELQKKMDMRYVAPPLPVDLRMTGGLPPQLVDSNTGAPAPADATSGEQALGRDPDSQAYDQMQKELDSVAAIFDGQ